MLRASQNPWHQEALLEEMSDLVAPAPPWAMKRHQGELRMFGGIWKKHASGEIPRNADRPSHLHGLGDPSAGEPGRAPGAGAGGGDLLGER